MKQGKGKRKMENGTARAVAPLFPFSVSRFPADGRRRGRSRQQGFTLIEVLVAFIVFVLIFGAVLDALGMAMRNTRRSAEVSQAALWAQSKLDAVGTIEELEEGNERGEFNQQFRWELDIRKQEVPRTDGLASDTFPVELYRVDLAVSWGDANQRKEQHFVTLRSKLKEGQF
jgi:general secretion pathway protein I